VAVLVLDRRSLANFLAARWILDRQRIELDIGVARAQRLSQLEVAPWAFASSTNSSALKLRSPEPHAGSARLKSATAASASQADPPGPGGSQYWLG
jgi:hypothetical protein